MRNLKVEISKDSPKASWDKILEAAKEEGGFLQSAGWARVLEATHKAQPVFLEVSDSVDMIAQALVMKRQNFDRQKRRRRSPLPYLECFDGPVIINREMVFIAVEEIVKSTLSLARRFLASHVTFSSAHTSAWRNDERITAIYRKHGFTSTVWATYLIDLRLSEEDLFKNLRHAARKNVKKCWRQGLQVVKMKSVHEFESTYWDAFQRSKRYFGRKSTPCFYESWEDGMSNYYHYYIVKDKFGKVMACLGMYIFNGLATEIASAISPQAYENKIPAQDLIHWEMILEAKRMGCHTFDLAGINPFPKNSKESGIKRFKEKWGGTYVEYNIYLKQMMPWLSRMRTFIESLRQAI